jgi:hypothetical protein
MIGDIGETVECPNCGRANPSWAQVCRNCGRSLRRDLSRPVSRPVTPFPTDQASLISVGAAVASIAAAIALGLLFSAINPTQPTIGLTSAPTNTPSPSPTATPSLAPTPTPHPTPKPTPKPAGSITFGSALNRTTKQVINPTDAFSPGSLFAYSVATVQPFGVNTLAVEVSKVMNGKETVVDPRSANPVRVSPTAKIFGIVLTTNSLLKAFGGGGVFVMRVFRGSERLAQGEFTLSSG